MDIVAPSTSFTHVRGVRMAYHRMGAGPPLLLVHGITTYSFIWRRVMPALAEHFDVIAPDLLGCGESDKPLDMSFAVKDHAEYLHEFSAGLGLGPLHFVGHDLGGGMGQVLAVRHPGVLRDLTVINSVAYDFWPVQPIVAMRTPIIRQFMMAAVDLGAFQLIVRRGMYHKDRVTRELMQHFMAPMATAEGRKAFLHFAHCLNNDDLTSIADALRHLTIPVLIVRGDADVYLSSGIAERLHSEIPGSRLARIATGGHFIQEDEPEWLAATVLAFVGQPRE